ncbi:MAG: phospho-sugar mutase, partial [Myxococcales bacterium]|nr:phospho-sugar mutase [Myxococcales bacterium]
MNDELKGAIETWIRHDPDPGTQAELTMLYDADDVDELTERFSGRLEFGTAGLRGKLGGGPNRMNRAVVITTTDGLARYLLSKPVDAATRGVVIGYDGRRMSAEFAEETARVLGGHGIPVHWFGRRVSTPLTAFAVTDLECAAGVMITASHNPPDYNGYKLYWNNGAQIIPPHDGGIEASIENAPPANRVTRPDLEALALRGLLRRLDRAVDQRYIAAVLANRVHPLPEPLAELPVVYTAMHGVGYELFSHLAKAAGFGTFHVVREQIEPDGEFPTVRLPNPEETSALEMAIELSNRVGAELILANDPDADRLAVCLRKEDGTFHHFSGDEIGILLADYLIREHQATGTLPENALVETTIVSSGLLGKMAKKHGLVYSETLTGFKWIANRALELEAGQKATFLFGYEEAIGYTIGRTVRDKDGISTALLTLEMWWTLKRRNQTLLERLEAIYREYD